MSTLTGSTKIAIDLTNVYGDAVTTRLDNPDTKLAKEYATKWTVGNCDTLYTEEIALTGAAVNRDLYGSLTDAGGNTINLATVRELIILNQATTSGYDLEVSGNFVTGALMADWVDDALKLLCEPGLSDTEPGVLHFKSAIDGFTVTDTTQERITLDPGANTFDVLLIIVGKTA